MPAVDRGIDNEEDEEDLRRRRTSPPSRGAVAASVAVEREEEEHQGAKARSPSTPTSPTGAGNKRVLIMHADFADTVAVAVVAASSSVVYVRTYSVVSLFQAE